MKYRKLRIAWSVAWGVACVLLIALWVRSYRWVDQVFAPVTKSTNFVLASMPNAFGCGFGSKNPTVTQAWIKMPTVDWLSVEDPANPWSGATYFRIYFGGVVMPYWFGVLLSVVLGIAPWIRWSKRFSLRTLLIATTLFAVVLGLIVWLSR